MKDREYSLVEMLRDPGLWVYETQELPRDDHYYLYRYDAAEERFYRATMPAGAAAVHFHPLTGAAKVPIDGWIRIEKTDRMPTFRPILVSKQKPPGSMPE